jgi:hypothetical protein
LYAPFFHFRRSFEHRLPRFLRKARFSIPEAQLLKPAALVQLL